MSSIALIPVFSNVYNTLDTACKFLEFAIRSRELCLSRTDAEREGVSVKLYIEDILRSRAGPILCDAGVPSEDIVYFHAPPLEKSKTGVWGWFAKKMVSYWDTRFCGYDWVVCWDSDVWWVDSSDFFKKLLAHEPRIGYIRKTPSRPWRYTREKFRKLSYKGGLSFEDVLAMSGVDVSDVSDDMCLEKVIGYLWCYPSKHFHEHHVDFINWMWEFAPYFGSDEMCAMMWMRKFGLDVFSIESDLGIRAGRLSVYLQDFADMACHLVHGKPAKLQQLSGIQKRL